MVTCAACGKDNPEGFAFCGFCTAPLAAAPPATVEERKVVTVLFCDPRRVHSSVRQGRPRGRPSHPSSLSRDTRKEIERYGGTVEKFIGDAVMAGSALPPPTFFIGSPLRPPAP